MLLSTLSRKAINIAVKSKRSFGGHRVLFVFRYKQQNCEVQQFENSYFELKHAPAHHHLKNQLGIRCRGTSRRTGDRHLFLPLREKQMQCHNIRRVEDRDQSSELFLEMDLQDYELHLPGILWELGWQQWCYFPPKASGCLSFSNQFTEQFSFTYTISMPTFVHEIKYIMFQDLQGYIREFWWGHDGNWRVKEFHFCLRGRLIVLCTREHTKLLLMTSWATSAKTSFKTVS